MSDITINPNKFMPLPKQCVLIGNGPSRLQPEQSILKDQLKDKFVMGMNANYRDYDNTVLCYVDDAFYNNEFNNLNKLPLCIGRHFNRLMFLSSTKEKKYLNNQEIHPKYFFNRFPEFKHYHTLNNVYRSTEWIELKKKLITENKLKIIPSKEILPYGKNTIVLKTNDKKYNTDLSEGVYRGCLVGLFSLTLACYLMDYSGEIFLLGYDSGEINNKKHAYNKSDFNYYYSGTEKTPNRYKIESMRLGDFGHYLNYKNLKIYNVSPQSHLEQFEKIDYNTFYSKLNQYTYPQTWLRQSVRDKLNFINENK